MQPDSASAASRQSISGAQAPASDNLHAGKY